MSSRRYLFLATCILAASLGGNAYGQTVTVTPRSNPTPSPSPAPTIGEPQDTIRVSTEEVRIPIFAYDDYGHFDPTLELNDILVLEDGVAQELKSLERVPGNILLLLCTSGDVNPAMRTNMTRDIALNLISHLGPAIAFHYFNSPVASNYYRTGRTINHWLSAPCARTFIPAEERDSFRRSRGLRLNCTSSHLAIVTW